MSEKPPPADKRSWIKRALLAIYVVCLIGLLVYYFNYKPRWAQTFFLFLWIGSLAYTYADYLFKSVPRQPRFDLRLLFVLTTIFAMYGAGFAPLLRRSSWSQITDYKEPLIFLVSGSVFGWLISYYDRLREAPVRSWRNVDFKIVEYSTSLAFHPRMHLKIAVVFSLFGFMMAKVMYLDPSMVMLFLGGALGAHWAALDFARVLFHPNGLRVRRRGMNYQDVYFRLVDEGPHTRIVGTAHGNPLPDDCSWWPFIPQDQVARVREILAAKQTPTEEAPPASPDREGGE